MYAVEFETNINSPYIELKNYEHFMNQHVKVIVLSDKEPALADSRNSSSYFQSLRQRNIVLSASTNIDEVMADMNNGLS
jgi:hypothetical protein